MSGDAPLLELLGRLAPNKKKKWAGWVQKLEDIGIDSPADISDMTPEDIGGLKDVPLKRVLEAYAKETNAAGQDGADAGTHEDGASPMPHTKHDGAQEESSPSDHTLGVAGKRGVLNRYLDAGGQGGLSKYRLRKVRLDGNARLLFITGGATSSTETINLDGASLDRCPDISSRSLNLMPRRSGLPRKGSTVSTADFKFDFLIRHGNGKKLLLQANNHEIFCAWTNAIANAGATCADSGKFETALHAPQFTLVPIGGSGVGKSTFVNFIIGSMWIKESNGFAIGYEDALFKTSSGCESMTTADDAKLVRRQWCGRGDVFNIMDTPGVFDVGGAVADTKNIGAVVEKLQELGEVDCFALVLNAAESRFSPQQAETIVVFDRILSSESAGSFLDHTVVVLNQARRAQFADERKTKSEYVKMIQASLRELESQQLKDGVEALVDQHRGKRNMYDDDELFSRLESRCVLFPCFEMSFTYKKASAALKLLLEHTKALAKAKRFDCSAVKTAETRTQELQKELADRDKALAHRDKALADRDEQIRSLTSKMEELQQREKQLDEKQAAVKKLLEEAESKGADTSALQEEKEKLEAAKAELRREYEEHEEKMGLLARRDALLDKIETAVAIVALVPLPGIEAVCAVCRGIIHTLRALTAVAEDILNITMLVSDVMDYMQRLRDLLPDFEPDQRDKISQKLDVLRTHLDAVLRAIADFQKKGWLRRCAKAKKARNELTNLDTQIRQALVLIDQALNLEMLKLNLRLQSYPMETAMEAQAPHLLTESAHVDALIAVAKAGGVSEEVFAEEVGEMRAELQSLGTDVTDLTKRYGETLMESFDQMRGEQRAMEAKLLASNEMLKAEISKRADEQGAEGAKMVEVLQQLLDRPSAGASVDGGATAGATAMDRMAAMEARQQLLEGATLVVQGREQEGMRKFAEVSSRANDQATSAMSEMSSMAAVARGAVEAKNGQS
jgi:hypothetical protein